tara:strand:- start:70 stop:468 length:399 start_codon:yes stop_codon:yes gene_type:complete
MILKHCVVVIKMVNVAVDKGQESVQDSWNKHDGPLHFLFCFCPQKSTETVRQPCASSSSYSFSKITSREGFGGKDKSGMKRRKKENEGSRRGKLGRGGTVIPLNIYIEIEKEKEKDKRRKRSGLRTRKELSP